MARATVANPCALSPAAAVASQKPAAALFLPPLRPSSSSSCLFLVYHKSTTSTSLLNHVFESPRESSRFRRFALNSPRKFEIPPLRAELSDVTETQTDLDDGESMSDSTVATITAQTRPNIGKAALLLKRDRVDLLLYSLLFVCALGVRMNRARFVEFLGADKVQAVFRDTEIEGEEEGVRCASFLKQTANMKFVESVETHFRLNIDPK